MTKSCGASRGIRFHPDRMLKRFGTWVACFRRVRMLSFWAKRGEMQDRLSAAVVSRSPYGSGCGHSLSGERCDEGSVARVGSAAAAHRVGAGETHAGADAT